MSEENFDLKTLTDDELIKFKEKIDLAYDNVCEERAKELESLGEYFDVYSSSGERKIKKIQSKYEDVDDGYSYVLEQVLDEMKSRNMIIDEDFVGQKDNSKISDEEYLEREIQRNDKYNDK